MWLPLASVLHVVLSNLGGNSGLPLMLLSVTVDASVKSRGHTVHRGPVGLPTEEMVPSASKDSVSNRYLRSGSW